MRNEGSSCHIIIYPIQEGVVKNTRYQVLLHVLQHIFRKSTKEQYPGKYLSESSILQNRLTGVRVRSHICDHKILTFVQRLYRIANIRDQVLNGTVLKRPALDDSIIIGFLMMLDFTIKY